MAANVLPEVEVPVEVKSVLIQHNGRVKTFDAFARQTLRLVSGKEAWRKRSAAEVLWGVALDRKTAGALEWIRLDLPELKTAVGIAGEKAERHYFSLDELATAFPKVIELARSSKAKRDADERPTAVEQKAEQLLNRMYTVNMMVSGELFTVVPPPAGDEHGAWHSPFEDAAAVDDGEDHTGHDHGPGGHGHSHGVEPAVFKQLLEACGADDFAAHCAHSIQHWNESVRTVSPAAAKTQVVLELFYLNLHPFKWAWIFYLLGFLIMAVRTGGSGVLPGRKFIILAVALTAGGWLFHTSGLLLRTVILARPPVSNMYESMVFMNWALMLFAFGFAAVRRTSAPLAAGAVISALVMIYADLLPIDPSMDVLVPVLRSNYWLTVHVLTVVASYGAFGLALALGHRHLIQDRILGRWSAAESDASARLILRVIEFGVILIGVGTVLGGVWANESWGRFWGWDPKETWALITLLGYLAVIHLRYFKKIGPFGLAVSTIIGFQLVLFTWYGVNFVLGRGLHSYGSGSGGMDWVLYYLAAQTIFLIFAILRPARRS